jgi:hypothetical protein
MNGFLKMSVTLAATASISAVWTTSCSDGKALSREIAGQLIERHEEFSAATIVPLATGEFCMGSYTREGEIRKYGAKPMSYRFDPNLPFYLSMSLEREGLTALSWAEERGCPHDEDWRNQRWGWRCFLNLTKEGERVFKDWPNEQFGTKVLYRVPIARRKLLEVTGIAVDSSAGSARTEFTWHLRREPAGALLRLIELEVGEVQLGEALLSLYDDGWRVTELKGTEVVGDWL